MCKLLKLGIGGAYDPTQKAHVVFFSLFLFFSSRSICDFFRKVNKVVLIN